MLSKNLKFEPAQPSQQAGDTIPGRLTWGITSLPTTRLDEKTYALNQAPTAHWQVIAKQEGIQLKDTSLWPATDIEGEPTQR